MFSRPTESRPKLHPLLKLLAEQGFAQQQTKSFALLSSCWILGDFCVLSLCFQRTRSVEKDLGSYFPNMCCWGSWSQNEWTEALSPQCSHYPFFFLACITNAFHSTNDYILLLAVLWFEVRSLKAEHILSLAFLSFITVWTQTHRYCAFNSVALAVCLALFSSTSSYTNLLEVITWPLLTVAVFQ